MTSSQGFRANAWARRTVSWKQARPIQVLNCLTLRRARCPRPDIRPPGTRCPEVGDWPTAIDLAAAQPAFAGEGPIDHCHHDMTMARASDGPGPPGSCHMKKSLVAHRVAPPAMWWFGDGAMCLSTSMCSENPRPETETLHARWCRSPRRDRDVGLRAGRDESRDRAWGETWGTADTT